MSISKTVVIREIKEIIYSKQIIFATIIGHLLALLITIGIFYHGVVSNIAIGVVDLDNSTKSREIIREINSTNVVNIKKNYINEIEAINDVKKGVIYGFVVIEDNFETKVLKKEQSSIKCYINGLNVMVASSIENEIYSVVSEYSNKLKINNYLKSGNNKYQAEINIKPIKIDSHTLYNPYKSFNYFLTISLLPLMLLTFVFLTSVYSLGIELKTGMASDFVKLINGKKYFILVKLLPYTFIYIFWGAVYSFVQIKFLSLPITKNIWSLPLSYVILVLTYQSMAILMVSITSNLKLSLSLGSAYTMMALTFAGVTFPSLAMDFGAQLFGRIFPYFYVIKTIFISTLKNGDLSDFITTAYPTIFYITLGIITLFLLNKRYSNSKYYYRD